MNSEEVLLTLEDVAERLKISVSTVRRWVKSSELRSIKVGNRGQYRISLGTLRNSWPNRRLNNRIPRLLHPEAWPRMETAIDWARAHTKYIVVIGGVISGLGERDRGCFIGKLLSSRLTVVPIKCDGYLNTDPGTMNPIEHGEVFRAG